MKELPFISEPKLPRKRRAPNYSIINHFSSSSSSSSSSSNSSSSSGSSSSSSGSSSSSSGSSSSSSGSNKQSNVYHHNTPKDYYRVIYCEVLV